MMTRLQLDRRAAGLCAFCGRPAAIRNGKPIWRCEECEEKARLAAKQVRARREAAGLCIMCGRGPTYGGTKQCFECLTSRTAYYTEYYHRKVALAKASAQKDQEE